MATSTTDTIRLSIGISQSTKDWLKEQGEQFDMPRDQIIEQLVEESVRMRRFPRIGFREEGPRRRACIRGTRYDVWSTIVALREMGRERILAESYLSEYDLDAAIAYYENFPEEIDQRIERSVRDLEDLERNFREYGVEIVEY